MRVNRFRERINNRRQLVVIYSMVVERDWFDYHTCTLLSNHQDSSLCRWWNSFREKKTSLLIFIGSSQWHSHRIRRKCPLTVGNWRAILGPAAQNKSPMLTSQAHSHHQMWNTVYIVICTERWLRRRPSLPLAAWFTSWWLPHHWFCIKYRGVTK